MPPAFRYFELVDEVAGRYAFWEIAIDGPTLELRHGAVGTAGKHEKETCASEALAQREYQLRIAAHLEDGFREVVDRRLDVRTRALEQAIDADPDDATAYLVYADWIQTLGDPRGGLIVAQAGGDEAAAATYLKQYEATFLGPLAEHVGYDGSIIDPTWRNGFIRRATVREDGIGRARNIFEHFLEHASTRWLGELTLKTTDDMASLQSFADVLAAHPLPHLTSLDMGEVGELLDPELDPDDAYWHRDSTDLSRVWAAVPALRRLVIRGEADELGTLDLPHLAHFELHVRAISTSEAYTIAGITGPLERLELRFHWPLAENLAHLLHPIFASPLMRGLDHLAITGARRANLVGTDGVCQAIAQFSPRSLRSLDLSQGRMTDGGASLLAESKLELDVIDVSHNQLSYRGYAGLERIAKLVIR